jgi:molybdenum cofactor cytidylyltransferase
MIVGIVLSAGESKRMGTPKQLLPWGKTFILQQVIDNATASRLGKILLVLGSHADEIARKITISSKTNIVVNHDFKAGMGSSVKCGVKNAPTGTEAFMLLLGDQPFISPAIIDRVLDDYRKSSHGIVIPVYNGKRGHPVIFDVKYKPELLAISAHGARIVMNNHLPDILEVHLEAPEILTDIDTPQDYQKAIGQTGLIQNRDMEDDE